MTQTGSITVNEAFAVATKLHGEGRLEEAKSYYEYILRLYPGDATICNRLGAVFDAQDQTDKAIELYKQAIAADPNYAAAYYNLANILRDRSRFEEAIPYYKRVLEIKPDHADALACYHHVLQHVCAWEEYAKLEPQVEAAVNDALKRGERTVETPFVHITRCDDQAKNLAVANSWAKHIKQSMPNIDLNFAMKGRKKKKGPITIGYLSKNLQDRPTGHLALNLFKLHNRKNFKIHAYSYGVNDGSDYRKKIQADCDKFVDILPMNYVQAAQSIYDDEVDILVDMQGYMAGNRLEISALRPAPIQMSYLGYPGTVGGDLFDYIITDKICVPKSQAANFSEEPIYMPDCYQINNYKQKIANIEYKKEDFGIPQKSFVFCSFNWSHKLDAVMFATWMEILNKVPTSVLWLWKSSDLAEQNLKLAAEKHGIAADRIIFGSKLPKDQHLARLRLVDLALDTRIYGGHTTTSDSLWAGTPVITMQGKHFASRVCSSILINAGLPELVTNDLEEYRELAVDIANNPDKLQSLNDKLEQNRLTCPLFDTPKFVKNLEKLYKRVWKKYCGNI